MSKDFSQTNLSGSKGAHATPEGARPDATPRDPAKLVIALQKKLKESENKLAAAVARADEMVADAKRARADLENYRKQVEKRLEKAEKDERDKTIIHILPLIDDLGRAIDSYPAELAPLAKNYQKSLEKLNLTRLAPAPGAEFDPELHNAISVEPSDGDTEVIAETLQAGYLYGDEILRPAMVRVKKV